VSAQITWSHNIEIMDKVRSHEERKWYIEKTIENGWSLNILANQIKTNLYKKQVLVEKTTNYEKNLSRIQGILAKEILKDPYNFDFITFREDMLEVEFEKELVKQVTKLLLELGSGFAFVGNQYHMEVAGEDFYIDLLFYHLKLKSYVVIELKTGKFVPEYAGKLIFYLSAVDDILKTEQDNPTIGLLLCREKNKLIAEYALKDMTKPIGGSEYKLFGELPEEFENALPTIEDLEKRINCFDGEIHEDERKYCYEIVQTLSAQFHQSIILYTSNMNN
jgi:predicted nuclease of restriction endonuclease-like (RecB) superfamily